MKKILLNLVAMMAMICANAQELGNVKIGASFGVNGKDGLAADATIAFPMNYMFDVAANAEFELDYSNVYGSLNTNISAIFFGDHFRYFEMWAITGFGWGHDYRKDMKIDHNFHTYELGLSLNYNPDVDWSLYIKPMMIWRDWQGNMKPTKYHPVITIGFTKMF